MTIISDVGICPTHHIWQLSEMFGGTECLRYPDGSSVTQEAWPTLQRLYPSLIIAKKSRPNWMQSKRMQNFQESSSVVTVFVKTLYYIAPKHEIRILQSKIRNGGPHMSNSCAIVLSKKYPASSIQYRVFRIQFPLTFR